VHNTHIIIFFVRNILEMKISTSLVHVELLYESFYHALFCYKILLI
jgi:hypothetical protein